MSIGAGLREGIARLRAAGIEGAARDGRLLMAGALGVDPARITLLERDDLPEAAGEKFNEMIGLRAARHPVSHLLGFREFYGRRFAVTPDVLDPRPETETLIAAALEVPFERALDLGTGSGCILLTLLAERAGASGIGADLSEAALAVAAQNAARLGLERRAELRRSDWFSAIKGRFDLITSNPPYIAREEMPTLAPELAHEPRMALTDEGDGLAAYRAISAGAGAHLQPGGRLLVEIGPTQGAAVSALFTAAGLEAVSVLRDLDGRDRVVSAKAPI